MQVADAWRSQVADCQLGQTVVDEAVLKYQDPSKADALFKVQQDLDETKIILHKTIESVLERGEKLDNLVSTCGSVAPDCCGGSDPVCSLAPAGGEERRPEHVIPALLPAGTEGQLVLHLDVKLFSAVTQRSVPLTFTPKKAPHQNIFRL